MKPWGIAALLAAVLVAVMAGDYATMPDGNNDTDKRAREVADRIGRTVGTDANAYARSALAEDTDPKYFAVIEITDSPTTDPQKVRASLVFRVHDPGTSEDPPSFRLWEEDPVTACYRADFNHNGIMDSGPSRIRCPADAKAITPPPAQPTDIPENYPEAFKVILAELTPTPSPDEVLTALRAKLPPMPVDEQTKLPWKGPRLDAFVKDGNVGIIASGGGYCLTGVRLADGTVAAWYPPRVQTQPGEYGCSGESALTLYKTPPPK